MKKITDTEQIRAANRKQIIGALRTHGPLARVELCDITGLSPATVTAITSDLFSVGFLKETSGTAEGNQGRGRPKVNIDLNPEAAFVIGIQPSVNELAFVLGDLKGNIRENHTVSIQLDRLDEAQFITLVIDGINDFIAFSGVDRNRVASIGIAMQGPVDSATGTITWSPALSIQNVPICEALESRFNIPVSIANDSDIVALALRHLNNYSHDSNLLTIVLGQGVGMGALINGQLYSGSRGAAAEFGHVKFNLEGPQCRCGGRGCIEAYAGDYALYRDAATIMHLPMSDNHRPSEEQMEQITAELKNGNEALQRIYDQAGRVLGLGMANLITLLDPERVIVTGRGVRGYEFMEAEANRAMKDALLPSHTPDIVESFEWTGDLISTGTIHLGLEKSD
ncbi:ROK family protein [Echinimonas agarilytica]|uniref:ROK family protein n=1 Tax=Echinimonas agarilytica TaxID=1215918 RepID=A0AA42B694_9GAMM|nr:ROK family protein [Echinimonas agarilytica]MCM2678490.1 ROK family protein [Echinimonas agarilytica]